MINTLETALNNTVVIEYLDSNKWFCDLAKINGFPGIFPGCSEPQAEVQFTYTLNGEESSDHNYTCYAHIDAKLTQIMQHELQDAAHVTVIDEVDAEERRSTFKQLGGDLWSRMTIIEKPNEDDS